MSTGVEALRINYFVDLQYNWVKPRLAKKKYMQIRINSTVSFKYGTIESCIVGYI